MFRWKQKQPTDLNGEQKGGHSQQRHGIELIRKREVVEPQDAPCLHAFHGQVGHLSQSHEHRHKHRQLKNERQEELQHNADS